VLALNLSTSDLQLGTPHSFERSLVQAKVFFSPNSQQWGFGQCKYGYDADNELAEDQRELHFIL